MSPSLTASSAAETAIESAVAGSHRIRALVDAAALRHNLAELEGIAAGSRIMPVIKADGYGHGAARVAQVLEDRVQSFAVAAISEALALRRAGVKAPLCVLGGVQEEQDWACCVANDFEPVVHAPWQWEQLQRLGSRPRFWLKFDTGMGRLGFSPQETSSLDLHTGSRLSRCIGLMTHLACADEPASDHTRAQLSCFSAIRRQVPELPVSIANSAAMLAWPETRCGVVRPGLALYGVNPLADPTASLPVRLQAAMCLEARVMAVRTIPQGHSVGYGAVWRAPTDTRIAVIAAGYADGIMRSLGESGFHLNDPEGHMLPLRGRISMDMLCVELPPQSSVVAGDWLPVWGGQGLSVADAANCAGTLPYELLTALGERVAHAVR